MKLRIKKVIFSLITFQLFPVISQAENSQWVEWIADVEVAHAQVNNINYSAFSNDKNDDNYLSLKAAFGRVYQFSGNTRMHVALDLSSKNYNRFSLMDSNETGINFGLRHKFGLGHYIPYLQINTSYRHLEVDAKSWSNDAFDLALEVGKHFTHNLSFAANLTYTSQNGDAWQAIIPELSSEVFDQTFWRAEFFADYILSQDWLLSLSYGRQEGDFNSACTVENVGKVLDTMQVKAITSDLIFGGCVYKLDGSNNIYTSNLSYALSNHSALNLSAKFYQGKANSLDYHGSNIQVSYNYRY